MKALKILSWAALALLVVLIIFIGFIPTLASSSRGREFLLGKINSSIPGKVELNSLVLSWFGPSSVEGLQLLDAKGAPLLKADSVQIQTPLFRFLPFFHPEPQVNISGLEATLVSDAHGGTNFERALSHEAYSRPEGQLLSPILVKNVSVKSELSERFGRLKIHAEGDTVQGSLQGHFKVQGESEESLDLKIEATKLPVVLIDQWVKLRVPEASGVVLALLGEEMDFKLLASKGVFEETLKTPHFNSFGSGKIEDEAFTLVSPLSAELMITPEAFEAAKLAFHLDLPALTQAGRVYLNLKEAHLLFNAPDKSEAAFDYALTAPSQNLSLKGSGTLEKEALTLAGEARFNDRGLENFHLQTEKLAWQELLKGDLSRLPLQFQLSADKIIGPKRNIALKRSEWLYNPSGEQVKGSFTLAGAEVTVEGALKAQKGGEELSFSLHQLEGSGALDIEGEVQKTFSPERSVKLKGKLEDFSTATLSQTLNLERSLQNQLFALFGGEINGRFHTELAAMQGPLSLALKGERVELDLQGQLSGGFLYLTRPLTASVTISKEVSDSFLDEIVPLLNSAIKGDQPLRLTVSQQGFRVPLATLSDLRTLTIPQASLDLGKIYFSREGNLAQVLSLLNIGQSDIFSVWFTPLYFSLQGGTLSVARLDMLVADTTPLATWGTINFAANSVNMEVGLTGRALSNTLGGIPLPPNYMLTLPLRGPVDSPRLDTVRVAAKIASLAAAQTAARTGPQGALIGGLIQLASDVVSDRVPEPTTQPLPWKVDAPEKSSSQNSPVEELEKIKPVKEIKKSTQKILNSLFGG